MYRIEFNRLSGIMYETYRHFSLSYLNFLLFGVFVSQARLRYQLIEYQRAFQKKRLQHHSVNHIPVVASYDAFTFQSIA